ncbi:hypothetical protein F441_10813 [Phytophthora nicotianae CJ01A1]|uniref:Uncharacterized protein n=2 Tax=Phytophthora nicotianae TaxID=4792 RepID=W2IUN9_PHYNI|nr:hypothetical protein L915_10624 [Phytophthora nicotianae]ETL37841.1 hypothetical protein L916_10514 [Phytophthora nicotianae]ETP14223.1 hypothetical protein F441_10813 [Phytophthora nicotianae CJ01A1]
MTNQTTNASAAGWSATETVSASSCSWKTTISPDGECFLEPRTCSECLEEIPSTGDTCVLTDSGICMNISEYNTLESHDGEYYLAGNVTYCDASNSSSDEDCVLLNNCESSTWLSYARQRLPLIVLAVERDTPEGCTFATDTVDAGTNGSALTSEDTSSSTVSSSKDTLSSDDKCTWYQNTTLCSTPRTCYDCLNTVADNGDACTITPDGYCASLSTSYNYTLDFRSPSSSGVANGYYYPSTNTTYCEPNDAACSNCGIAGSASNSVSYCVGSAGCICVAFCQSAEWQETVVSEKCAASTSSSTQNMYGTEFPWKTFVIYLSLAVVAILAVILGVWRVRQKIRARRRESTRLRRSETRRSTLSLELPAWKAMREELIDKNVDPVGEGRGRLRPM